MQALVILLVLSAAQAATFFDCPSDWVTNDFTCYKFVFDPKISYEQARAQCGILGTSLLSVNSKMEHDFINAWLIKIDYYRNIWYTSGIQASTNQNQFLWASDGSIITDTYWLSSRGSGEVITYKYDGVNFGWYATDKDQKRAYICEVSQTEAYRLTQERRGFDYGQLDTDMEDIEFGPKITIQPTSLVIVARTTHGILETRAQGNPQPKYKWYKGLSLSNQVTYDQDKRYTLTNGKLTIQTPTEDQDADQYQCMIENEYGTIFSDPVSLSFGYLGEFSNVKDAPVYAYAYDGAVIQCSKINYKPAAVFNWQRGEKREYIFSETTPYIFISSNGRLYFSEVTRVDEEEYYCQITLTSLSGSALGTSQAPSKTSLGIHLSIRDQAAKTDWGPEIQDDFIAVFPQPPLKGQDVRLECFAYGSAQNYEDMWSYQWLRKDLSIPKTAKFEDYNRVMIIKNARLEDQGTYTCLVKRGNKASDNKSIYLRLEAKPYYIIKLQDQHVDQGSQLTWRCEANGYPSPVYRWYKNGKLLSSSDDGSLKVTSNILVIQNLEKKLHDGMYQCSATNIHGTAYSSAQLRVLSFPPSFAKFPVVANIFGALNGNISIACRPEAAPKAEITWSKNGGDMNLRTAAIEDGGDRMRILPNGNLFITGLTNGDNGFYTCVASNEQGEARSGGRLAIKGATTIVTPPDKKTFVIVNDTAFIECAASYDSHLDLIYVWKLNGYEINFERETNYKKENSFYQKGLYIRSAQFRHMGEYTCIARTPLNEASSSGLLVVEGPPGEPAGLFGDSKTVTSYSIRLHWFPGAINGRPILYYVIQSEIEHEKGVWNDEATNIPDVDTITVGTQTESPEFRSYTITGLKPGNGYRFRVQAVNELGYGTFSLPSDVYQTNGAPPSVAPTDVRGGGGSVGDLTMVWDKQKPVDHGGPGLGYFLYWRQYDENPINKGVKFNHEIIRDWKTTQHVEEVGLDNYYLLYEVKMQAFNNYGRGPNSTVVLVYSAEGMPVGAPQSLYCDGHNSTAMLVTWVPVPDTRKAMKGRVKGYQVNYWSDDDEEPLYKQYIRYPGQVSEGIVIGLWADSNFWFEVLVYNTAGLGPVSEKFIQETLHLAPGFYPQEVHIYSNDASSVKLVWRGVALTYVEAVLTGYYIYLWPANEHYRTAEMIEVGKFDNEGYILQGIEKGKVYAVRIAGFSDGGEGKKSPTVYFTLGGQVPVDPTISEIRAGVSQLSSSASFVWLSLLCVLLMWLS